MHQFRQRLCRHLRFRAAAYLVLLIALVPAFIVYWRVQVNVAARDEAKFNFVAARMGEVLRDTLENYAAELPAISGRFEASGGITAQDWNTTINTLELGRRYPGIRSVGFAEKVSASERVAFVERIRREAEPAESDFDILPASDLPVSFPTVYVTLFLTNADSRPGWDLYSDPVRRAAIDQVLKTGLPAITDKVSFWGKETPAGAGFTILAPFRGTNGSPPKAVAEVRGVVFSSFIPQTIFTTFSNRYGNDLVALDLFDGGKPHTNALLASSGTTGKVAHTAFSQTMPIHILGHPFLLRVTSLAAFDSYSERHLPRAVLAGGLAFSILLFGIVWVQSNARRAAEQLNARLGNSEEQLRTANGELRKRIVDSRLTEELLAYERDLLRTLLDHSPDRIYFKDRDSRFIKCGKAVIERLGLTEPSRAMGRTDFDFFTVEYARPAFELEKEIVRTGKPIIGLVEKETWRDGRESWVLTSKMPLRDKQGHIIGTFGISKDISELKAAERALEKEKELLGVTLRSIADGVITTDVRGAIVLFNEVAASVTGWSQAEAVGKKLREVFLTRDRLEDDSATQAPPLNRDSILMDRNGLEKSVSQSVAPIIDSAGNKVGAVLVFRDVTEKLQIEAELLKANKLESIGVLAGGIAHDFNNILTVILGNISMARLSEGSGLAVNDALAEAENASLRARELTQRLLTFAKGGAPIKKALDLASLVKGCAARSLEGTDVQYEVFVGEELWTVQADESQLAQVASNLISNARASMSKDPRLDIHVFNQEMAADPLLLLKPGKYVRISIRDYGTGIQPENLTKIFEPYFGGKKQGPGHGLELATAYSIIRKHEGQIRVESISGQGTVFHIYLPALEYVATPVKPVMPTRKNHSVPLRVLVVDDELAIRKLATLMLKKMGHTPITAADGVEAIGAYESSRQSGELFDAVIMDLTIPHGMGGKETIARLKTIDPGVRAIVCSGYSHDPVMAHHRDYGFSGVMPKPYSAEDLALALDELFIGGTEDLAVA